jgi:hypothetical protein
MAAKITRLTDWQDCTQWQRAVQFAVLTPGGQSGNFWIHPPTHTHTHTVYTELNWRVTANNETEECARKRSWPILRHYSSYKAYGGHGDKSREQCRLRYYTEVRYQLQAPSFYTDEKERPGRSLHEPRSRCRRGYKEKLPPDGKLIPVFEPRASLFTDSALPPLFNWYVTNRVCCCSNWRKRTTSLN